MLASRLWAIGRTKKSSRHAYWTFGCIFHVCGEKKPLNGLTPIFSWWEVSRRNHACQIWWRSLKGFMGGLGVKFQHFPLTLLVILTTLTLPCERNIYTTIHRNTGPSNFISSYLYSDKDWFHEIPNCNNKLTKKAQPMPYATVSMRQSRQMANTFEVAVIECLTWLAT